MHGFLEHLKLRRMTAELLHTNLPPSSLLPFAIRTKKAQTREPTCLEFHRISIMANRTHDNLGGLYDLQNRVKSHYVELDLPAHLSSIVYKSSCLRTLQHVSAIGRDMNGSRYTLSQICRVVAFDFAADGLRIEVVHRKSATWTCGQCNCRWSTLVQYGPGILDMDNKLEFLQEKHSALSRQKYSLTA